jgi:hypothetical protein
MPIQWYRQPDGTWVLWNTEEAPSPSEQIYKDYQAQQTQSQEEALRQARQLPDDEYKQRVVDIIAGQRPADWESIWADNQAQRSPEDHRMMKRRLRELRSDNLMDRLNAIDSMFKNGHIIANEDTGALHSRYRLNEDDNQRLLDAAREYNDYVSPKSYEAMRRMGEAIGRGAPESVLYDESHVGSEDLASRIREQEGNF